MKKLRSYISVLLIVFVLSVIAQLSLITAFATGEIDIGETQGGEAPGFVQDIPEETSEDQNGETQPQPEQDIEPQPDQDYDVEAEDEPQNYEPVFETVPQQDMDNLPQVESQAVVIATSLPIPDIEVSDTSLIGGVIAWLCVALGIALIAGILASQRARQRSTGSSQSDKRR